MRKWGAAGFIAGLIALIAQFPRPIDWSILRAQRQGDRRLATARKTAITNAASPLYFEPNRGQTDSRVQYLAHGAGYAMFLTGDEVVLRLDAPRAAHGAGPRSPARISAHPKRDQPPGIVRISAVGTHPVTLIGQDALRGHVNYFVGRDPSKWHTDIPTFARVAAKNEWPGIDAIYYGSSGRLESDFVIAPGANAEAIAFTIAGADDADLDALGDLTLTSNGQRVTLHTPKIYQEVRCA